jgi:hypothetical protein
LCSLMVWCTVSSLRNLFRGSGFWGFMVSFERLRRRLLLVGTGLRSVAMFVLLFGVLLLGVVQGDVDLDVFRVFDPRLLVIVLPGFVAFAGVWLGRRWGAALAVASCLIDTFWWGWVAGYATRRYGGISLFMSEYAFFSVFYGAVIVLAVWEFKKLGAAGIQPLSSLA